MSLRKNSVIIKRILTDKKWGIRYALATPFGKILPDRIYLKIWYWAIMGKKLNLNNPQTFNEKLQWLKLYDRKQIYTTMVDKYLVKEYVAGLIGEEYIIPTLGIFNEFEEINFDELPDQFVLKCTNDSGGIAICKDKATFDLKDAKCKLECGLKKNYYYYGREWPYKNVKPRIIAEKYMSENEQDELADYKLMCFNSKVYATFVCTNRGTNKGLHVTFFNTNWDRLPFERCYPADTREIEKPKNYQEMIALAEKLSENIPFVRVDFYKVQQKIYFGELTFYPGGGIEEFNPEEWDYELGKFISLPGNLGGGGVITGDGFILWIHKENASQYMKRLGLKDYKFYCFNGKPEFLYLSQGLDDHDNARISYLDFEWNRTKYHRLDYREFETLPCRPENLEEMVKYAQILSKGIPFVRVDFYDINHKIYFGELTFYPGSGLTSFEPEEYDAEIGKKLNIHMLSN